MNKALDAARRFFEVLEGTTIDPDYFDDSEVWAHVGGLLEVGRAGRNLSPACLALLNELSAHLAVRARSEPRQIARAIEAMFGPSPDGPDTSLALAVYLRDQRNGGFFGDQKKKGPSLKGEF